MKILWAVTSIGLGHLMRDMVVAAHLSKLDDVQVDWLVPRPANEYLKQLGISPAPESSRLLGSGKTFNEVFNKMPGMFDLIHFVRADWRTYQNDFTVTMEALNRGKYDLLIGDEAFWIPYGYLKGGAGRTVPVAMISDFIGLRRPRGNITDQIDKWLYNFRFAQYFKSVDRFYVIGERDDIPEEQMGAYLPGRRAWAEKHCQFIKPFIGFDATEVPDRESLRLELGIPLDRQAFLAVTGSAGASLNINGMMEKTFTLLKRELPQAYFLMITDKTANWEWIDYRPFVEKLYLYFAAMDAVIIQTGYLKVLELCALGVPFIAMSADFSFEQEYVIHSIVQKCGSGLHVPLRICNSGELSIKMKQMASTARPNPIPLGNGEQLARELLLLAKQAQGKPLPPPPPRPAKARPGKPVRAKPKK